MKRLKIWYLKKEDVWLHGDMKLNTDNQFLHINKEQMRLTFVVSKEEYVKMESFHEVIHGNRRSLGKFGSCFQLWPPSVDLNTPPPAFPFSGSPSPAIIAFSCAGSPSTSVGVVKKVAYSVYNSQKLDEYIQPSEHAKNENADFDVHWKINTTTQPKITQNPEGDAISPEKEPVAQVRDLWKLCKTPWWETVKPWQFVKAYRFQNGFYDIPCQVQLRLCVDGDLEWLYEYPSCQPWETSYEDFLYGYMNNEQPSPQRLLKMLRTDFQPRPEYGNNLSSELIDQMLKILRD